MAGDEGEEKSFDLDGSRHYFNRILASEQYSETSKRDLSIDSYLREGEATWCLLHM